MDSSFEWLKAYNFISFETTTSTNDQAFNLAKEEVLHNHVISLLDVVVKEESGYLKQEIYISVYC